MRRRMSRRVILLSINVPAKSETVFPSHAPSARPVPPSGIRPRPPPKPRPGPEGRGAGNRRPRLRTCTCQNRTAGLRELAGTQLELGATGGTGEQPEGVGTGGFRGARALPEVAAWASAGESTFCGAHGPCGMGGGARRRPRPQRTAVTSPEPQLSPSLPSVGGACPGFGAGHGRPSHLCGVTGLTGAHALPCQARGGSVWLWGGSTRELDPSREPSPSSHGCVATSHFPVGPRPAGDAPEDKRTAAPPIHGTRAVTGS